jgi:hypothetical protein
MEAWKDKKSGGAVTRDWGAPYPFPDNVVFYLRKSYELDHANLLPCTPRHSMHEKIDTIRGA